MNKSEFNELPIEKQIEYLNNKLSESPESSLFGISKEIGIAESTLRDRLKSKGYKYNSQERTIFKIDGNYESNTNKSITNKGITNKGITNKSNTNKGVTTNSNTNKSITNDSNTSVIKEKNNTSVIPESSDFEGKFNEMYAWYKEQLTAPKPLVIDPKEFDSKITPKTFKIYDNILEKFNEFCTEYSQYSQQDLINTAILNIIKQYSNTKK